MGTTIAARLRAGDARTIIAARRMFDGGGRSWRGGLALVGPAVVASVAYVDPGNFATNIQAGSAYGYGLLWVVLLANVAAMLFQGISARLGIVTGHNLAELCRDHLPVPLSRAMWVASEIGAMATDLAEFLGASIGLNLLFGWPMLACMLVTGAVTYGILLLENAGFRPLEAVITALVGVIGICYLAEMLLAPPDWAAAARGTVLPRLRDGGAVTLAVAILGATLMPHALFLHSGLTQNRIPPRNDAERGRLIDWSNREVLLALGIAGLINMAMLAMAAAVFNAGGHTDIAEIGDAYRTLVPALGLGAAGVFLVALLASGISSSVVGTMAGQMIMQGFLGFTVPIWLRRLLTMAPAFVVVALGVDSTRALVLSQVVLSLVLPVPMLALLRFAGDPGVMGRYVLRRRTRWLAGVVTALVLALNLLLLLDAAGIGVV